jgi:hypothetical protein
VASLFSSPAAMVSSPPVMIPVSGHAATWARYPSLLYDLIRPAAGH